MVYLNMVSVFREICHVFYDKSWHEGYNDSVDETVLKKYENSTCVVGLNAVGGGPVGSLYNVLKSYKCNYIFVAYLDVSDSGTWLRYNKHLCDISKKIYFKNLVTPSPDNKFAGVPLGPDFWTNNQLRKYKYDEATKICSEEMDKINNSNITRKLQIYNDYHTTKASWKVGDFNIRLNCIKFMREKSEYFKEAGIDVVIMDTRISQEETFKKYRESTFVLSPPGNGFDCHRHFEALIFGAIPIIIKTKFFAIPVYDGLPLLEIEKIEDLTPELLLNFQKSFKIERKKLMVDYWKNKIRNS